MKILINSIESEIPDSSLIQIGQGGEGIIYLIALNGQKYAIKKYYKPNENLHKKVKAMLGKAPDDSVQKINSQIFIQLAWPIGLCYDGNSFCGFVMPYVDLNHTNTLDFYLDPRLFKEKFGTGNLSLTFKIEIARNLAGVVKLLHSKGHFFIDFKPQNVRVYDRSHFISLIDCDGFSIEGSTGERFPANGYSSEYIYPEALQENKRPQELGIKQDLFALSVVIFQLLNYGIHPFSGIISSRDTATTTDDKVKQGYYPYGLTMHPHIKPLNYSAHNSLPNNLRVLFDKAFIANSSYPPKIDEWIQQFEDIISNQRLQRCKKHPTKPDHIHFSGHDCMTCMREQMVTNVRVRTPPIKSNSTSATSNQGLNQYSSQKTGTKSFLDIDVLSSISILIVLAAVLFFGFAGNKSTPQQIAKNSSTSNAAYPSSLVDVQFSKFEGKYSVDGICAQNFIQFWKSNSNFNAVVETNKLENIHKDVISLGYLETIKTTNNQFISNIYRFRFKDGNYDDIQLIIPGQIRIINKFDNGNFDIKDGFIEGDVNFSSPILKKCS